MSIELSNVVCNEEPKVVLQEEPKVIQNSDYLYKNPFPVVENVPYIEPNDYEKNMNKDSLTPEQLLQHEEELKNKPKELTDEEKEHIRKRDYITKVKVIANNMLDKHPTANPSFYSKKDKAKMIEYMQYVIGNYSDDDLDKEFNEICNDKLFVDGFDYSCLPVYDYNISNTPLYDA